LTYTAGRSKLPSEWRGKLGKLIGILIPLLTAWGALARIWPDVFVVGPNNTLKSFIWGPRSIWVAVIASACILGAYIWSVEERLANLPSATGVVAHTDELGLQFVSWGPFPDGSGCVATIDASKVPSALADKYEIALVCGFADPAVDFLKDTRISVSPLFTLQSAVRIALPFSKGMAEALAHEQRLAIDKIRPKPAPGTMIGVANMIWLKTILLPKGSDHSNVQKLSDVPAIGGKIAEAQAVVGLQSSVPAP
jgi:hypothetical protein